MLALDVVGVGGGVEVGVVFSVGARVSLIIIVGVGSSYRDVGLGFGVVTTVSTVMTLTVLVQLDGMEDHALLLSRTLHVTTYEPVLSYRTLVMIVPYWPILFSIVRF